MSSSAAESTPAANAASGTDNAPKVPFEEIEIRPFTRDDLVRLPRLLHDCLGRHSTPEWLEWRFFQGVWPDRLAFYVAEHHGELVAFIGANPVPYSVDGEKSPVYQHQDTAIREDCRSLKLLRTLVDAAERRTPNPDEMLTYSITTPHMKALVTKRMKYTVIWEDLKMVKPVSLRAYVSKATKSAALTSLIPGPMSRSWKAPSSMTGDVREIQTFGPEFDTFWAEANKPGEESGGRIFAWQDAEWLNYKYCNDAMVDFKRFAYYEGGRVLGYVILNITQLDVKVGYLDALWAVPGRTDVIDLLVDFGIHELVRNKTDKVDTWCRPETPLGKALSQRGFQRRPTSQCFSIKQLKKDMGDLGLKGEHWNIQRGNTYYTSVGHLSMEQGTQRLYQAKEAHDQKRSARLRGQGGES